jgi:hypothetical protein
MSVLYPILSERNVHSRDKHLAFDEPLHKYTILNDLASNYTSVTKWNHSHFPSFDTDKVISNIMRGKKWKSDPTYLYYKKSANEIKDMWSNNGSAAAGAGTNLHFDIECFMNQYIVDEDDGPYKYDHELLLEKYEEDLTDGTPCPNESIEWKYFLDFAQSTKHFVPYRTEWMIYDEELKLAGSIDMVYENPDGTLSIYDWKRSKDISKVNNYNESATTKCIEYVPNSNYWHYSLQLNTYKAILEKNYGKKVTDLYLVRLHPNNKNDTYELIKCADLQEEVATLFDLRKKEIHV